MGTEAYAPAWNVVGGYVRDDDGLPMKDYKGEELFGTDKVITVNGKTYDGNSISGIVNNGEYEVDTAGGYKDYYFKVNVSCTNTPITLDSGKMPETGGEGTYVYLVAGAVVVSISTLLLIYFFIRRRQRAQK